jgi:hypothetical protein
MMCCQWKYKRYTIIDSEHRKRLFVSTYLTVHDFSTNVSCESNRTSNNDAFNTILHIILNVTYQKIIRFDVCFSLVWHRCFDIFLQWSHVEVIEKDQWIKHTTFWWSQIFFPSRSWPLFIWDTVVNIGNRSLEQMYAKRTKKNIMIIHKQSSA